MVQVQMKVDANIEDWTWNRAVERIFQWILHLQRPGFLPQWAGETGKSTSIRKAVTCKSHRVLGTKIIS